MSRIINCARTGLAAGAVTLLMSHAASAAQINIHVPTPVIHVPTPVIHLPTPTVRVLVPSAHIKTPEINAGAASNHTLEGGVHGLVSRDNQNALKSTNRQLQKDINNPDTSTSLPKQTSTISPPMGLSTAALPGPANGGTPSGGGGIGWSELAALLGKDRINSAISFHPSRPTVFPGSGGAGFYSSFQMPTASGNGVTYYNVDLSSGSPGWTYASLFGMARTFQGFIDSINEMSEMTSMRLQMGPEVSNSNSDYGIYPAGFDPDSVWGVYYGPSKPSTGPHLPETNDSYAFSNVLKRMEGPQHAIIQNMK